MRDPFAALETHAERAEATGGQLALGLAPGQLLGLREDALGEVPEALLADAAGDRDLAARGHDLEHQPHLAGAPPAVTLARRHQVVLEVAREQRAVALELAQHVAAEAGVRAQEVADPLVALQLAAAAEARHPRPLQRQVLDRVDEGVVLEQLALLPEQRVELAGVELAEPAEEDELLRRRHRGDRVHLQEAEPSHGVEHPGRGAVEQLRAHGDPPGLLRGHHPPGHVSSLASSRSRSRTTRRITSSPITPCCRRSWTAIRSASSNSRRRRW